MTKVVEPMTDERIAYLRGYADDEGPHGTVLRECLDEIEMLRKEAVVTADNLLGAGALAPIYANIVRGERDAYKARSARLQDELAELRREKELLWQELTLKRPIAERAIRMYRDGTMGSQGAVFGLEAECREYEIQIAAGPD